MRVEPVLILFEKKVQSWEAQGQYAVGARVLALLVSEALALVGIVYHSMAFAMKTFPATVKLLFTHFPLTKVQRLGEQLPEWATWQRLRVDHAVPLWIACRGGFAAPLAIVGFGSPARHLSTLRQAIFPASDRVSLGKSVLLVLIHLGRGGFSFDCFV